MELLSQLTTMRVGGPASRVIRPSTEAELIAAARELWDDDEPWLVLGGGSNMVVGDEGFDGTVIHVVTRGIETLSSGDDAVHLRVQAGEPWDDLVSRTIELGLTGIEALSGIPGSSGAAPIQNIGAYGQELSATLVAVDYLEYPTGQLRRIPAEELELGYRTSAIKRGWVGIVVAIELALKASAEGLVEYDQLASALGVSIGSRVPSQQIRDGVLALRASKGMILDPSDPDSVSCGSFFTNPIVSENFARNIPGDVPRWPVSPEPTDLVVSLGEEPRPPAPVDDRVKLSAAWLIEQSGIHRGFSLPGSHAAISSKHTLAITNRGGATAEEVGELARYVEAMVLSQFGIILQPEPVAVGVEI